MAKDVKMFYIEDDIKKIQTKTNLYIQKYGPEGAFHLVREIIQNSIDEVIDPESNGSNIYISYDMENDKLVCEDDGRGFPETDYSLDIFCTKNQSGSKFFRDQGGSSAGEFGVGLTVVNALSTQFTITSYREKEDYKHTILFEEGEKKDDQMISHPKEKLNHGSRITFIPSKKYLGKNTKIPYKDMVEWIEKMTYFIYGKKVKITVDIFKGLTLKETYKFKPKKFDDLLDKICIDKEYSDKCSFNGDNKIEEMVRRSFVDEKTGKVKTKEEKMTKKIHLDVALRYTRESITYFDTYCNYTNTIDGGIHQSCVEKCFCNYMQNKTKASMSENQREKTPILWDDVREGLCCVINLTTNAQVGFVGNVKTKIGNEALVPYLNEIILKGLDTFFEKHPQILNDYIKIIRLNAKARIEANKVKIATQREKMNSFKEHEMKNLIMCTNRGKQWKEIFITEGDSAGGSARNGSDTRTQAFFLLRGVVANAFKKSLAELMDPKTGNREWRDLVTVLRCGIGKNFDINKLYFNRINILTDQDIDGYNISSGILAFFYKYLPEIIKNGYLYKVYTPLYAMNDKEHPFVRNKHEMVLNYHKKLSKIYKIKLDGDKDYLTKKEFMEFLSDTYDYASNLVFHADDIGRINKFLLERIVSCFIKAGVVSSSHISTNDELKEIFENQKFINYISSEIQKKYKEVYVQPNSQIIRGIVDGRLMSIKITERLLKKVMDLVTVLEKYGYEIKVLEKGKDKPIKVSIGEFLDMSNKYNAKITERYKGLGEIDGQDLYNTALDINKRTSVQYTMEDAERELQLFNMIHGPSSKDLEKRKEMMRHYKISRDDLDN